MKKRTKMSVIVAVSVISLATLTASYFLAKTNKIDLSGLKEIKIVKKIDEAQKGIGSIQGDHDTLITDKEVKSLLGKENFQLTDKRADMIIYTHDNQPRFYIKEMTPAKAEYSIKENNIDLITEYQSKYFVRTVDRRVYLLNKKTFDKLNEANVNYRKSVQAENMYDFLRALMN